MFGNHWVGRGGSRSIFFATHPAYTLLKRTFCALPGSPGSLSPRQVGLSLTPRWVPGRGHSPSSERGPSLGNTDPQPGREVGCHCVSPSPAEGSFSAGVRASWGISLTPPFLLLLTSQAEAGPPSSLSPPT